MTRACSSLHQSLFSLYSLHSQKGWRVCSVEAILRSAGGTLKPGGPGTVPPRHAAAPPASPLLWRLQCAGMPLLLHSLEPAQLPARRPAWLPVLVVHRQTCFPLCERQLRNACEP